MKDKKILKKDRSSQKSYLAALGKFEQRIEDMFHNLWHKHTESERFPDLFSFDSFNHFPKMDVVDRDKEIFVQAELPGFEKDDLDISLTNNRLVIKAKARHEKKEEKGDYFREEISKSEVYRSVLLPDEVEGDNIITSFKNGILELTMPKHEKSHRKQIKID